MKDFLRWAGILAALAAIVLGLISTNVDARGQSDVSPMGALAVAVAALALLKASELAD